MTQICDVMSRNVKVVAPADTIRRAAECMDELNVGAVPVCEGDHIVGMVTDRDIAVRAVASGKSSSTPVSEVMSEHMRWCYDDQSIEDCMDEMCDAQIRRLPVIDHEHHLVGIVSLGDVAARTSDDGRVGQTLKDISSPLDGAGVHRLP